MGRKKSPLYKLFDCVDFLENVIVGVALTGMFFTIMALAAGFNKAESSRVVLFLNLGPKWLKKFSEVLYAVIVIGFFGFMVIYGWELVMQQKMLNEMGTALRIPMTIIGFCVPLSGVLGITGTIQSFLEYRGNVAISDDTKAEGGNEA